MNLLNQIQARLEIAHLSQDLKNAKNMLNYVTSPANGGDTTPQNGTQIFEQARKMNNERIASSTPPSRLKLVSAKAMERPDFTQLYGAEKVTATAEWDAMARDAVQAELLAAAYPNAVAPKDLIQTKPQRITSNQYANAATKSLVQVASGRLAVSPGSLIDAQSELSARGFKIEGNSVTLSRADFEKIEPSERSYLMISGAKLNDTPADKTPTARASALELTFPEGPKRAPRTAAQFFALSDAQVSKLTEEASQKRSGLEIRQEIFDAFDSLSKRSWRHSEINEALQNGGRQAYYGKFKDALVFCGLHGPSLSTPNDPVPPISPNAMTARQFLELNAAAVAKLSDNLRYQVQGRNIRAELKRAYRNGSSAEKVALFSTFEYSLRLFPNEPV